MTVFSNAEIKELVRAIVTEILSDGAVLPLCRIETTRLDAIEKSLMAAYKILTGGDNPEQGLVAKTIRQDGALALNRIAIENIQKASDLEASRA